MPISCVIGERKLGDPEKGYMDLIWNVDEVKNKMLSFNYPTEDARHFAVSINDFMIRESPMRLLLSKASKKY